MGPNLGVPLKVLCRDTEGVIGLRIARKIKGSLSRGYGGAINYRVPARMHGVFYRCVGFGVSVG